MFLGYRDLPTPFLIYTYPDCYHLLTFRYKMLAQARARAINWAMRRRVSVAHDQRRRSIGILPTGTSRSHIDATLCAASANMCKRQGDELFLERCGAVHGWEWARISLDLNWRSDAKNGELLPSMQSLGLMNTTPS